LYNKLHQVFSAAKIIIILLGTNLLDEATNTKIVHELLITAQMLRAKYRDTKIYIGTLIPRIGLQQIQANAKIPIINSQIKKLAPKLNIGVCNLNKSLVKGGLPKGPENWSDRGIHKGLHLSQIGNTKVKHYLIEFTKKLIK